MIAASMIDAGLSVEFLREQIGSLGIDNVELKTEEVMRGGMRGVHFLPVLPHEHVHRNLSDIRGIIEGSGISDTAKGRALGIFERVATAEACVHGKSIDEVHFHEVGALDSIVDIVSAAVGIEALGLEKVYCSVLRVGGGEVKCAHGLMPVPAPATAELLKGLPFKSGPVDMELLTPTAAAIFANECTGFREMPAMCVERIGYGAGTREAEGVSNVLRLFVGEAKGGVEADEVCVLEANVDDVTGEIIGGVCEKLMGAGALDVFTMPVYMKRNRPAVMLSVICEKAKAFEMERIIFSEGVTFGIRRRMTVRSKLVREIVEVETRYGKIGIKRGFMGGEVVNVKCEYKDCAAAAEKHGVAIKEVMSEAMRVFEKG
jgi:hypothetical protein